MSEHRQFERRPVEHADSLYGQPGAVFDLAFRSRTITTTTKGGSAQLRPTIIIDDGDLDAGDTIECDLDVSTDTTPGGDQSYTRCGVYEFNSGATLKFRTSFSGNSGRRKQSSFSTDSLLVCVRPIAPVPATDDCDGDGEFADTDPDDCDAAVTSP